MNNRDTIYEAVIHIEVDTSGVQQSLNGLKNTVESTMTNNTAKAVEFSGGVRRITESVAAAYVAFKGFGAVGNIFSGLLDSYNEYESAMNGVKAVASNTGNSVSESMQVIKDVTANGLITQTDAAAAVKNLESYGYTAQEAAQLINVMADAAAYNRQSNYSLSEAVRVTTEGIRMENSVLSDASGVQKNIAKMYDDYAKSLGKSTNDLTQAEKAQAVLNGFMKEGAIYAGNAAEVADTLSGAQSRLNTQVETLKQNLGQVLGQAVTPIVSGLADWLSENQALVGGLLTFVGVLIGGKGVMVSLSAVYKVFITVKEAITAFKTATITMSLVAKVAAGGLLGLAAAAAGIGVFMAISNQINKTADVTEEAGDAAKNATPELSTFGNSAEDTAKKVAKLRNQLDELTRDYNRDLKKIAVDHQENLDDLTRQIEEANIDYRQAIDERMADFNVSMMEQERSHQETVGELMTQLAFLQRYNNDYNKQKLTQVQFALAKEQELYKRETEAQQAEIELQNQADKQKLDAKLASLQQELDDEMAFMNKHRDELKSVQNVMLLDEVESLNERYQAQKASYEEQIFEAGIAGSDIANNFNAGITDNLNTDLGGKGEEMGRSMIDGMWKAVTEGIGKWLQEGGPVGSIFKWIMGEEKFNESLYGSHLTTAQSTAHTLTQMAIQGASNYSDVRRLTSSVSLGKFSSGGYTGPGPADEVAGIVHKGEYVIPKEDVDQSTGRPKVGSTINQTFVFNLSGVLATSQDAKRELAKDLKRAFDQGNQARLAT